MSELPLNLSDLKVALKRKGLHYKLQSFNFDGDFGESLCFVDAQTGAQICGKIVRSFTEGEVYHWPVLSHENLAPLIDVININDKLNIFITIDRELTLKNIIHDEDFVHDPRCFDRKKMYAKGIFRGLSYLHSKSLCLMNLSDSNVVICKITDQAILTNFSDLACSRKTVRSKLGVPELYKAPESEKGEFDVTAAEMWAAGTLMLDMFLAHMVPWAIVDYKPCRIMEIVDKLSFELLQAANIGSVLSFGDLTKFKTFLKCFFKAKPLARIAAQYASIASFLSQEKNTTQIDVLRNPTYQNPKYVDEKCYFSNCHELPGDFSREATDEQSFSEKCGSRRNPSMTLDTELEDKAIFTYRETSFLRSTSPSNSSMAIPNFATNNSQENVSLSALEIQSELNGRERSGGKAMKVQDVDNPRDKQRRHSFSTDNSALPMDLCVARTAIANTKMCRCVESNQIIAQTDGTCGEVNYTNQQSRSLSFLKSWYGESVENENSFNHRLTRSCSHTNLKTLSVRQLSVVNSQKSDLYLERLFNEEEETEETGSARRTTKVAKTASKYNESDNLPKMIQTQVCTNNKNNLPVNEFKEYATGVQNLHAVHPVKISGIQDIVKHIILLRECQFSLHRQPRLQISDEFAEKQEELIREYELLLHRQKMKLYDTLKRNYALKTEEIMRLMRAINVKTSNHYRCSSLLNRSKLSANYHYSRLCDSRFIIRPNRDDDKRQVSNGRTYYRSKVKGSGTDTNFQVGRRHSFRVAMHSVNPSDKREFGGTKRKTGLAHTPFAIQNESKDKLIDNINTSSNTTAGENKKGKKISRKRERKKSQKESTGSKDKDCKTPNKNKDKSKRHAKVTELPSDRRRVEASRRSFFLSLCPGGKVQKPTPVPSLLSQCETCKLKLEDDAMTGG